MVQSSKQIDGQEMNSSEVLGHPQVENVGCLWLTSREKQGKKRREEDGRNDQNSVPAMEERSRCYLAVLARK